MPISGTFARDDDDLFKHSSECDKVKAHMNRSDLASIKEE